MRGGGVMDAGGRRGGVGGRRRAAVARTCMFENLRESNSAEINAREEENKMRRRVLLKYTPAPTNIQINPHNAFQGFQDLSKTFKVRLLFSSTPDTQTSKLPIDFQGT